MLRCLQTVLAELGPISQVHIKLSRKPVIDLTLLTIRQDIRSMANRPIYDLVSNGDVVLTLRLTRLRVSSAVLSTASPVFRAMFGPNFLVGQDVHSAQNPREIPLEDDDSHAMMRLCYLLHHQRDPRDLSLLTVSSTQGAKEFLMMAGLADKYGCAHSVNMVSAEPLLYFDPSKKRYYTWLPRRMFWKTDASSLDLPGTSSCTTRSLTADCTSSLCWPCYQPLSCVRIPHPNRRQGSAEY